MYVVALLVAFAAALIGIGGLELAWTYEQGVTQRTAGRLADDFVPKAEQAYVARVAALVQQGVAIVPGQNANISSTPAPLCPVAANPGGNVCGYSAAYAVATTGSTAVGGAGGVQSDYINVTVGEERIAATLTVDVFDARGTAVAERKRTFIVRTIPGLSPYASIIDSTATEDVYQSAGTTHAALSEGDSTCNGGACGASTVIQSYAACNWGNGAANSTQVAMQQQWCASPPPGAGYNPGGAANANGNWTPEKTTTTGNAVLHNTNAANGGSN